MTFAQVVPLPSLLLLCYLYSFPLPPVYIAASSFLGDVQITVVIIHLILMYLRTYKVFLHTALVISPIVNKQM